jgi:hypothetical protein
MIQVTSDAFDDGEPIPKKYSGEGENVSPPISWSGIPEGAEEIALTCSDPDAPRPEPYVHWVLWGMPAEQDGLPEGQAKNAQQGNNSAHSMGYTGPMPPEGHGTHHYEFRVMALDTNIELSPGASADDLARAMEGHILDEGKLVGTYER